MVRMISAFTGRLHRPSQSATVSPRVSVPVSSTSTGAHSVDAQKMRHRLNVFRIFMRVQRVGARRGRRLTILQQNKCTQCNACPI